MSTINPECDGAKCRAAGEVRKYPLGGGANLYLCAACFAHENAYRRERGAETKNPEAFPPVDWRTAAPKDY